MTRKPWHTPEVQEFEIPREEQVEPFGFHLTLPLDDEPEETDTQRRLRWETGVPEAKE